MSLNQNELEISIKVYNAQRKSALTILNSSITLQVPHGDNSVKIRLSSPLVTVERNMMAKYTSMVCVHHSKIVGQTLLYLKCTKVNNNTYTRKRAERDDDMHN